MSALLVRMIPAKAADYLRYDRILDRILEQDADAEAHKSMALKLLGWLSVARRPMKWYEIQGGISINLDDQTIQATRRLLSSPKQLCSSLVEYNCDGSVELVHSTTRQLVLHRTFSFFSTLTLTGIFWRKAMSMLMQRTKN